MTIAARAEPLWPDDGDQHVCFVKGSVDVIAKVNAEGDVVDVPINQFFAVSCFELIADAACHRG